MGEDGRLTAKLLSKLPYLRACQVNLSTLSPFGLAVLKGGLATLVKTAKPPRLLGEHFTFSTFKSADGESEDAPSHLWHCQAN